MSASPGGPGGQEPERSGWARTLAGVGGHLCLVAEGEEIQPDPGPVAVIAVVRPECARLVRRLPAVVALHCGDHEDGHEN